MIHSSEKRLQTPAQKAIQICWTRCVASAQCKKYLQSTEILGLIRELERFLGVLNLLEPKEETLLKRTISNKPQLRLFRGECVSFILGLVHFGSVDDFLATRFKISADTLQKLVEKVENSGLGYRDIWEQQKLNHDSNASVASRYRTGPGQSLNYNLDTTSNWAAKRDKSEQIPNSFQPWYARWKSGLTGSSNEEWERGLRKSMPSEREVDDRKNKSYLGSVSENKPGWLAAVRNWIPGSSYTPASKTDSSRNVPNVAHSESSSLRANDIHDSKFDAKPPSIKLEESPKSRRIRELKESLAEIRSQTLNLQNQPVTRDEKYEIHSREKSMEKTLDELQAAVRDQARLISRLEKERSFGVHIPRRRGCGLASNILIPWDYFIGLTTTFLQDFIEELWPRDKYWSVPEFFIRVASVTLGYFVILNFFKLVYLLAILVMHSSDTGIPYIYDLEDSRESAPLSWIQQFPLIEYWDYCIRDWWGY